MVLDVDSTLIGEEVVDLLAALAGVGDEVAAVTAAAMAGELDFAASLRRRVSLLRGLPESVFTDVGERITVTDGVPELIAAIHATGGAVAAVSGGFRQVLDPLAEHLGLDRWRANELELSDGALTGRVLGDVVDAAAKRSSLEAWTAEFGAAATVAVGDGANDLAMMAAADLSVAFDAKTAVRAAADVCIGGRSLRSLLPLLGLGR